MQRKRRRIHEYEYEKSKLQGIKRKTKQGIKWNKNRIQDNKDKKELKNSIKKQKRKEYIKYKNREVMKSNSNLKIQEQRRKKGNKL